MGAQTAAKRKRRADGELGDLEEMDRRSKPDDHYFKGIYKAEPRHFAGAWPTVQTETFVQMVFGSIKERGEASYADILTDTSLKADIVGKCLADLLLTRKSVATRGEEETRMYFVK